jgi:GDP-4-dehydro-6-deoxy-D-mannose reductase
VRGSNVRVLITGVGGFVGGHLLKHLLETAPDTEVHGTILAGTRHPDHQQLLVHEIDLKEAEHLSHLIDQIRPDQIYHLAAQASPRMSFQAPWETLENNIRSQVNLIQACIALSIKPRILVISSAEIYGPVQPDQLPIQEDSPLRPTSPYGVSKVAQDMLGLQYYLSHRLPIIRVRPFNHIGPGQSEGFVTVDFAIQIARIETGQQVPILEVGNLTAQRDFMDVRDVVRAYRLLVEQGVAGEVYNVASGQSHSIQSLLNILLSYSTASIEIRPDPRRMLPVDVPLIQGDASRLRKTTGWTQTIPFEQTLQDVLDDCRRRVRESLSSNH